MSTQEQASTKTGQELTTAKTAAGISCMVFVICVTTLVPATFTRHLLVALAGYERDFMLFMLSTFTPALTILSAWIFLQTHYKIRELINKK